uniref:Rab3 GTPase-activating protein catalytic subunit n=1 Tax=Macrostomum lignano TaxID=282301 RepID=A0A1I8I1L3_9PLAT
MISAFEVAQFVNDEQSWRELADPRKFPLPPDLEPECELDIRPSQRVPEPTLLLVEFDQIVGQNILLTQPTLATSAVDRLNESLQVVFGVNYQEATAMSHFSIVPESTSVFPDIEFPTYMRRAIAAAELSVAHLPIRAGVINVITIITRVEQWFQEFPINKIARPATSPCTMWKEGVSYATVASAFLPAQLNLLAIYLANPDSLAERLQPDEIRTLALTDQAGLDSSMAAVCTAIQVVSEFATSSAAAAEVSDGAAARLAACLEAANEKEAADSSPPTLVKIMSIHASDAKREMKPIWMLLGMDRDELTGLMAEVVKTVKASDDDQWAWSLPSLLGEVLEQLLLCRSGAFGSVGGGSGGSSRTAAVSGDRGQLSNFRSRVGSMASSTCGGGGTASIDSFKSLASCRDDTATASTIAAAAAAAAGGDEFHSVGSSNASSMERIYAREWSWTVTNGEDTEM